MSLRNNFPSSFFTVSDNDNSQHLHDNDTMRNHHALVVQKVYNTFYWIHLYPEDITIVFPITYPLYSDLFREKRYPAFQQLGPGLRKP